MYWEPFAKKMYQFVLLALQMQILYYRSLFSLQHVQSFHTDYLYTVSSLNKELIIKMIMN